MSDYLDNIEDDDEPTAPFWMATFSDMATLLLTFFVMIVAMSEVKVQRFKEALSYFQGREGMMNNPSVMPTADMSSKRSDLREQSEHFEKLEAYLHEHDLEEKVQVNLTERGLHVVITDSVMFRSGEALLIEPSRTILTLMAGIVEEGVQHVTVEGHTDDRPIRTARYPSNWELSTARAASVIRFLLNQPNALAPERYMAAGYGEYRPVDTNATPEGRARNRRVEILFSWKPWQNSITPVQNPTPLPER